MSIEEQSVRSLAQLMGVEILEPLNPGPANWAPQLFVCTMHAPQGDQLLVVPPCAVTQFAIDFAYLTWADALESLKGTTKV